MVRRIRIQNYKSLRDVQVELKPLSVLFGPNAAGKSNFLDALQILSRITSSGSLKKAFEPPNRGKPLESISFGEGGLDELIQKASASFRIEVDVELSPFVIAAVNKEIAQTKRGQNGSGDSSSTVKQASYIHHPLLRYWIQVEVSPRSGFLHVADEHLVALDQDHRPKSRPRPFIERKGEKIHLRMEGQAHPIYYERYLDHSILSKGHHLPHYPHLSAIKREFESWHFYYLEPRHAMRFPTAVKEVRHIGLMGEELASFLHTLRNLDPRQFDAVESAVHSLIPSITGIRTEVNKIGEVELSLLEGKVSMSARIVSEGTLRILGLLAMSGAKEPPAVITFEEPENGVHPRRIRDIAKLLVSRGESENTQLIVTTHSAILPDHLPRASLFVCRKTGGSTSIEPFEAWGPLWERSGIDQALEDDGETMPVSQRLLRGDFDA